MGKGTSSGASPNCAQVPEGWDCLRIGEMFSRRVERGRPGLPVMSITMTEGLVERDSMERRVDSNLPPEGHLLVRAGDLAYNMMRMWQGVLGRGRFDCLVSPAYVVLQAGEKVVPEFAEYLFSSKGAIAEFKRLSYGVVDDRLRLYYRDLVRIRIRCSSLPPGTEPDCRCSLDAGRGYQAYGGVDCEVSADQSGADAGPVHPRRHS